MPLPLTFKVQLSGDVGLLRPDQLARATQEAMQRAVLRVLRRATLNLTGRFLRVRTGRLRSSLTSQVMVQGNEVVGIIGTNVFYGRIHEEGAPGPWSIFPRRGVLRFQIGGKTVFARRVTHPGLKPRPWLGSALLESREEIKAEFARALKQAIGGGAG